MSSAKISKNFTIMSNVDSLVRELERTEISHYVDKYVKENGINPIAYMTKGQYKKWVAAQPKRK